MIDLLRLEEKYECGTLITAQDRAPRRAVGRDAATFVRSIG
jgi:hypothetical protein